MTAGNYIGYFAYMIDNGEMTEEEANIRLKEMLEADMRADDADRQIFALLHSGDVVPKEQSDMLYEFATLPMGKWDL